MRMIKIALYVAAEVVDTYDALAKKHALSRSGVMRQGMQVGLDPLRLHLESGKAVPAPDAGARPASGTGRPSRRRKERRDKLWRCPRDWEAFDKLEEFAEELLTTEPDQKRASLKVRLESAATDLLAHDPAAVVERVLSGVLLLEDDDSELPAEDASPE